MVRVEKADLWYQDGLCIKDRGWEEITQLGIGIRMGLDGKAMDGEWQIRGGKSAGEPGIVGNWEWLIKLVGQCIKKEGVRSSRNGGVNDGERAPTVVVNENLIANKKARIDFP